VDGDSWRTSGIKTRTMWMNSFDHLEKVSVFTSSGAKTPTTFGPNLNLWGP